jgi:hypothetical protein
MLKIPIKNITVKILVIWQAGKKETAETFDTEVGYKEYNGEKLWFKFYRYGVGRLARPNQSDWEDCPRDLDFEIIHYPVVGFVELKNF